jgi:hypothetical protein
VFGGGQKVWILLELADFNFEISMNDSIKHYLLLLNGHDAGTSIQAGVIPVRFWCMNMMPMIGRSMIKFKHTKNAETMLEYFRLEINRRLDNAEQTVESLRKLVGVSVNSSDLRQYIVDVFQIEYPIPKQTVRKIERIEALSVTGRGLRHFAETWYSAFQAIAEYLNYETGRKQETRLTSLWLGKNGNILERALTLALERV